MTTTTAAPYALTSGHGTTDLWWPYGPTTGRYTFKTGGEQTDGRLTQFLATEYRGAATPLHIHRDADETFFVVSGTIAVVVGDERFEVESGGFVFAPMGVPHAFVVVSEQAEILVTFAGAGAKGPEGLGVEGFFREVAPPVIDGDPTPDPSIPDIARFASKMDDYGIDLVGPPPAS
jgi:mannose-6-phosphate isomerase-like protein (cupin superfamily)